MDNGNRYSVLGEGYNGEGAIEAENNEKEDPQALEALVRVGIMANEGGLRKEDSNWIHHGDAMDVALLGLGFKHGRDPEELKQSYYTGGIIPYESERKFSGAFYTVEDEIRFGAKGALETILGFCHCDQEFIDQKVKEAENYASKGYRVLAFAEGLALNFEKRIRILWRIFQDYIFGDGLFYRSIKIRSQRIHQKMQTSRNQSINDYRRPSCHCL